MTQIDGVPDVVTLARALDEARAENAALKARLATTTEERLRILIRDLQVGVLIQGPHSEILLSNPKAAELLGLTEDQLHGKTSFDPTWNVIHEDGTGFPANEHPVPVAIATKRPVRNVIMGVYHPVQRARVWLLVNADPELERDGQVLQVVCTFADITERKKAEEILRDRRQLHLEVFELTLVPKLLLDPDSATIVEANPSACAFYGYSREDLCAKRIWEINVDGEAKVREYMAMVRTRQQTEFEFKHQLASGEIRDVRVYANPVVAGGRKLLYAIIFDITEAKKSDHARRQLARAVEQSSASIVITDRAGAIEYVNPRFEQVTGYTRAEVLGQNPRVLKSGLTPPEVYAELWRVISEGKEWQGELCNRRKTGELFWELASISGVRDDHGVVGHYVAVKEDITERRRVEQALRESEERYKTMFESAPIAVNITRGTEITYANPAYLRLFGLSSLEELRAYPPLELFVPAWRPKILDMIRRRAEGLPVPDCYEAECMRKDGSPFPILMYLTRAAFPGGVATLGFIVDITDQKRAEKERARLQEQFQHAQRMESVGRLAGGVAHDFNNMLGVILGNVDLAMDHPAAEPLRDDLEEIKNAAKRSAALTRQLLAFARKQTAVPRVLDLNDTIAGMLKMLQRLIGENIRLTSRFDANLWPVLIDPSQIDQILANLCVNARDAIENVGNVTIETKNASFEAAGVDSPEEGVGGDCVLLSVQDDGCGMDESVMARAFEPFFTTKEVGKGTGLGLATVYGIVKQNGGAIHVTSEPGRGTTFNLYFPRHTAAPIAEEDDEIPHRRGGHETVLVVEDEPAMLKLTTRMLESLGYHVLQANRPSEALRLTAQHMGAVHMLVADVVMPEMNGRELISELRRQCPSMKYLFMSGYSSEIIAQHGVLGAGINFIQKPFSAEELSAKVRAILDVPPKD